MVHTVGANLHLSNWCIYYLLRVYYNTVSEGVGCAPMGVNLHLSCWHIYYTLLVYNYTFMLGVNITPLWRKYYTSAGVNICTHWCKITPYNRV